MKTYFKEMQFEANNLVHLYSENKLDYCLIKFKEKNFISHSAISA